MTSSGMRIESSSQLTDNEADSCLLYTSDAADEEDSVDLGGRRIIKKIFFKQKTAYEIGVRLVGSEMCIRDRIKNLQNVRICCYFLDYLPVSYTHLTLPTKRIV